MFPVLLVRLLLLISDTFHLLYFGRITTPDFVETTCLPVYTFSRHKIYLVAVFEVISHLHQKCLLFPEQFKDFSSTLV